jgi:hypothetical protein
VCFAPGRSEAAVEVKAALLLATHRKIVGKQHQLSGGSHPANIANIQVHPVLASHPGSNFDIQVLRVVEIL